MASTFYLNIYFNVLVYLISVDYITQHHFKVYYSNTAAFPVNQMCDFWQTVTNVTLGIYDTSATIDLLDACVVPWQLFLTGYTDNQNIFFNRHFWILEILHHNHANKACMNLPD